MSSPVLSLHSSLSFTCALSTGVKPQAPAAAAGLCAPPLPRRQAAAAERWGSLRRGPWARACCRMPNNLPLFAGADLSPRLLPADEPPVPEGLRRRERGGRGEWRGGEGQGAGRGGSPQPRAPPPAPEPLLSPHPRPHPHLSSPTAVRLMQGRSRVKQKGANWGKSLINAIYLGTRRRH